MELLEPLCAVMCCCNTQIKGATNNNFPVINGRIEISHTCGYVCIRVCMCMCMNMQIALGTGRASAATDHMLSGVHFRDAGGLSAVYLNTFGTVKVNE